MDHSSLPSQNIQVSKADEREEEPSDTHKHYQDKISTLPSEGGGEGNSFPVYQYQGFWYYSFFLEGIMSVQEHFKAQPTDIILCSPPKTGTNWLKALTFAIVTRSRFDDSTNPLLTKAPRECVPFLEGYFAKNSSSNWNLEIPLVHTHIPYTSLPHSIIASGCKIVYICRDPKDAFVSMWHFSARFAPNGINPISFDESFDIFCKGVSHYGPYWDHVLGYWRASLEWPERILFLKYEDMLHDTSFYIKRLGEFMGYPFSLEEEKQGMVEKIKNLCSFENLSNLEVNKSGNFHFGNLDVKNNVFFRKGKIGDWKNHMTALMADRLDHIMEQKLSGSSLTFMSHHQNHDQ